MNKAKSRSRKTSRLNLSCVSIALPVLALLSACMSGQPRLVQTPPDAGWQELFDGETLDTWRIYGGKHEFTVVDGIIIGTAVEKQPSAFLITDHSYDNFILEADFLSDGSLNSGIMFRAGAVSLIATCRRLAQLSQGRAHFRRQDFATQQMQLSGFP